MKDGEKVSRVAGGVVFVVAWGLGGAPCGASERSEAARQQFMRLHPCPVEGPGSCFKKGFVIDHMIALKCGGRDAPDNMQWQTVKDAKIKDRWELKQCDWEKRQ